MHGFDEFFGNLYHLNAEEEPEHPDYPKPEEYPNFRERFGPRGVLHTWARDKDDPKETAHFGPRRQAEDRGHGPADQEADGDGATRSSPAARCDFIDKAHKRKKPFFVWWNSTRMHVWTHLKRRSQGKTGLGVYPDGMVEHDGHVGRLLDQLDKLGITENTIVIYSTDNGAEVMSWPDGGSTPFRGEKATNWEGGFRVPMLIRWPGVIEPGTVVNEICAHEDLLTTFLAAAGEPDIAEKCLKGHTVGDKTFKVRLDGYNLLPEPPGRGRGVAAQGVPVLVGRRRHARPAVQRLEGRVPRAARASGSASGRSRSSSSARRRCTSCGRTRSSAATRRIEYHQWMVDHLFLIVPAAAYVGQWLQSFREYPPRMTPASFNLEKVMAEVQKPANKA